MRKLLCPSMMCADYGNLKGEVEALEEAGADMFHVDIMDGHFVPNFAMGLQDLACIAKTARRPVDAHLMIDAPERYIDRIAEAGASVITIHVEAGCHAPRTLQQILDRNVQAGIALNPGTPVEQVELLLPLVQYVLVMTVNPGFAGQRYLPFVNGKIDRLLKYRGAYGYRLLVDGACSPEKIAELEAKGVDGFVLGTSALFGRGKPYARILSELRALERGDRIENCDGQ